MKDLLFEQKRTQALLVTCVYCGREPGKTCINPRSRAELEHQAAHLPRIKAGERHALTSSARQAETTATPQTVAARPRQYGTRGWFTARTPGRCGVCWRQYEPGTEVLAIGPRNLAAECCANAIEENA